ncbi:MAG: hypothetical protein NTW38_04115 [Candidatus Aminicenantes bacterium]|nr:hypothetical protein [Candidatus Aminicenantes bacterium]
MNALFLVSMVVEAVFGIGFIFAPDRLLGPMGVTLNEAATTFARLFGSAIISFPVLLFFARISENSEFRKGVVKSMFIYYIASDILLLLTQLQGQMNALGWSVVVLHLLFTLWFGYFLIKKQVVAK